jgi:hypothetical protein
MLIEIFVTEVRLREIPRHSFFFVERVDSVVLNSNSKQLSGEGKILPSAITIEFELKGFVHGKCAVEAY